MGRGRGNPWIGVGLDAWRLGLEASCVISLRAMKLAQGGTEAQAELGRMIGEKVEAAVVLQGRALSGGLGATPASAAARTLAHYRRKVKANRRRLSRC